MNYDMDEQKFYSHRAERVVSINVIKFRNKKKINVKKFKFSFTFEILSHRKRFYVKGARIE